jgi:NADH:ubiquinone oxidoreductase subunit E
MEVNMEFECDIDLEKLKKILDEAPKEDEYIEYKGVKYIKEQYVISKSKIKEKIEEYKKTEKCKNGKYCNNCCTYYSRCKLLQELMEDK